MCVHTGGGQHARLTFCHDFVVRRGGSAQRLREDLFAGSPLRQQRASSAGSTVGLPPSLCVWVGVWEMGVEGGDGGVGVLVNGSLLCHSVRASRASHNFLNFYIIYKLKDEPNTTLSKFFFVKILIKLEKIS